VSTESQAPELAIADAAGRQVASLNRLLAGEQAAEESYALAIEHLDDPDEVLYENRDDHRRRISLLEARLLALGGEPAASPGAWPRLARLVERGGAAASRRAIHAALEEGEDQGIEDHRTAADLDHRSTWLVGTDLLPSQKRSHARLRMLLERG
jgi:hypothetical protein